MCVPIVAKDKRLQTTEPSRELMENLNNAGGLWRMEEHTEKHSSWGWGICLSLKWEQRNAESIWKLLSCSYHGPWGKTCTVTEVLYCTAVEDVKTYAEHMS